MTLPPPDPQGRHRLPDGSYVWMSLSGRGWCGRDARGRVLMEGGRPRYFEAGEGAAGALEEGRDEPCPRRD